MELGSEVCTPKSPACNRCPVATLCRANIQQVVSQIPKPAKRTNYEDVTEVAVIIRHRGRVLLRHCQPGERWAGLWDFPRFALAKGNGNGSFAEELVPATRKLVGLDISPGERLVTLKHGVTRFRITLHCYHAELKPRSTKNLNGRGRWVALADLAGYALSTTGRQISELLAMTSPKRKQGKSA
jgi:A/G-specific adenine glycosylase